MREVTHYEKEIQPEGYDPPVLYYRVVERYEQDIDTHEEVITNRVRANIVPAKEETRINNMIAQEESKIASLEAQLQNLHDVVNS